MGQSEVGWRTEQGRLGGGSVKRLASGGNCHWGRGLAEPSPPRGRGWDLSRPRSALPGQQATEWMARMIRTTWLSYPWRTPIRKTQ
jgi:hypothetical protein